MDWMLRSGGGRFQTLASRIWLSIVVLGAALLSYVLVAVVWHAVSESRSKDSAPIPTKTRDVQARWVLIDKGLSDKGRSFLMISVISGGCESYRRHIEEDQNEKVVS
ncbi:MAG: hypothetical protein ABR507_08920, partial [Actinomycetota bacterium]